MQNAGYRACSHHGRNGFSPYEKGSCSITQLLSRPKVSKGHCMISQELFLYSVRTLSSGDAFGSETCVCVPWRVMPMSPASK